ncbi:hypothetical protein KIN20_016842 [Parelaphostrongylus tenuis]|uniref:Uncharacterized protein n=1 Tax=Parelaphostrongylus tenuis TaxID=148309 RepID=A0AAD5QR13_PARTN|nr:hypothetical protein KIN20_016842 [Parelaphostrongylus tenuis]
MALTAPALRRRPGNIHAIHRRRLTRRSDVVVYQSERTNDPSNTQHQNVMTMFNIMNMLMGQNANIQLPSFTPQQHTSSEGTPVERICKQ